MTNESVKKKSGFGWVWWIIFPPYALYRLLVSKVKWYIKIPIVLLAILITLLAVDMSASPHRVEDAKAKETISKYLSNNENGSELQSIKRLGEGISATKKEKQGLVYYKAISDGELYHIGLESKDGKQLSVKHVEQLYPIRMGIKEDESRTKGEIALWLIKNQEKVGKVKALVSESEDGLEQVVKTDKGVFTFKVGNQKVYQVKDSNGKTLLNEENAISLPVEITDYLKENKDKAGKLVRTLGYEVQVDKELYYFRTTKGEFVAEYHTDKTIALKKKR